MKKLIYTLVLCLIVMLTAGAENFPPLKYKNIGNKDKISYNAENDTWSRKVSKTNGLYFIKTKGFGDFYDYLDADKNFAFSTNCEYEFINDNNFIGYSNKDLKFYYISYSNGGIAKRELTKEEVQTLFPDYTVITLSEFSKNTNVYKIKKHMGNLKILLLNDTDRTFDSYQFSSGNADFEKYSLRGFISISKKGMIQFSGEGVRSDDNPWYILLVR